MKPGWKAGTKITFQREGDQAPNKIPADIVFIIKDKPHPHFRREGSDLKYTCRLTLKEVRSNKHTFSPYPFLVQVDNAGQYCFGFKPLFANRFVNL